MKRTIRYSLFVLLFLLFKALPSYGAAVVSGSNGANGSYGTLSAAFTAINNVANSQTGYNITIQITSNLAETANPTLNGGTWSSIVIYPTGAYTVSRTVSGNFIQLNGADNVTFDGRINQSGSSASMTIKNTRTTNTAAVTMYLYNGAVGNTIKYCNIYGGQGTTSNGTIWFGAGTNTGNTIDHCNISNNGVRRPNALYSSSSSNTGNSITYNNFFNTWITNGSAYFINLSAPSDGWTITDNSFYDTGVGSLSTNGTYSAIYLPNATGTGYNISRNYIGGESAHCTGSSMSMGTTTATNSIFYPIYLSVGTGSASTVQNNYIQNINYRSNSQTPFSAINIVSGDVYVDKNVLGDTTGLTNLIVTTGASTANTYGINVTSTGSVNVTDNILSDWTLSATTTTFSHSFVGIRKTAVAGALTMTGNLIGHATLAGSITINSTATGAPQTLYGIQSAGTGTTIASSNTVANLVNSTTNTSTTTAGTVVGIALASGVNTVNDNVVHDLSIANANAYASTTTPAACGLLLSSTTAGKTVSRNTIYNISNSYSGASALQVTGIHYSGATTGTNSVSTNFIHSLSASNTSALIYGLYLNSGATTFTNNIVNLSSPTSNCTVNGVYDAGSASSTTNFYHNSIYIGGSSSSSNSYAFYNAGASNTRNYRNNIFYNARSRTSSGSHYGLYVSLTTGTITCNYNEYYVSGTGGVLGYFGANKTALPIVTGQDANSLTSGPSIFRNAAGTTPTDYKPLLQLAGTSAAGVTIDFGTVSRSSYTMGAWEFMPVEIWNGSTYRAGYGSLKLAFDKINDGTWTGNVICKISGNTSESVSAVLNAGTSPANYSSVLIYPTMGGLQVSGSIAGPLVLLSGADNVTLDGRVNATGEVASLTISNSNASGSAVSLKNSAQNNTITYCNLLSSGTPGIVSFLSDDAAGATNHNNALTNCNLISGPTGRVTSGFNIPNIGTATYSGLSIQNNTFQNLWSANASSYGIFIGSSTASSGISISGNSFFETTDFQPTGSYDYYGIYINSTSTTGFDLTNNSIGGQAPLCGGSPMALGNSVTAQSLKFIPIRINAGSASESSVEGNTIKNIAFKSASSTPFTGIQVEGGAVQVGTLSGNAIGSNTGTGSIVVTATAGSALSTGIHVNSTSNVVVQNNSIGSVTLANSAANAHSFYGIAKANNGAGALTVSTNLIGSETTASSIQTSSSATGNNQYLAGIFSSASGDVTIHGNTVANLVNSTSRDNVGAYLYGIHATGGNANTVSANFVYNLNLASAGTLNELVGLSFNTGSMSCINNIVYLGGTITTGLYEISGIKARNSAFSESFYHNSVYISGTITGSTSVHTYAFNKILTSGSAVVKNNIFFNARSGGSGTGRHVALAVSSATNLTSDYNIFHAPNTNGVLGMLGATSYTTIATWRTATGTDDNTANANPNYVLAGGTLPANYNPGLSLPGATGTGVGTDFGGTIRMIWTAGAWESAQNQLQVWNGSILRASYVTLKDAIDKINDGTWTGDLTIKINSSTTETASIVLNASGTGLANYSRLLIYPQASGVSVTGNLNAPLFSFNGADNVTINGSVYLNNTTPSLTFVNNSTGTSASTLKFSESAQNNCVQYCVLKGNPASATQGVVLFSTSATGTGNSTDTIANCKISGNGSTSATRPYNAVYSAGTSGRENTGIVLSSNEIFDFLNPGFASNGILIAGNSTNFTISNNSFYETTAFASTAAVAYNVLYINNTSGGGFNLTGNYIGGNAAACAGVWIKTGNNNLFNAIQLNVGTSVRSSVQGNILKGFNFTNSANADWLGINVVAGGVDVGTMTGNVLGEDAGTNSIYLTNTTTGGNFYGIYLSGASLSDCQNNILGSINVGTGTSTLSMNFYGIYKASGSANLNVSNNIVGGMTTENSLRARSLSTSNVQTVIGIYSAGTGLTTITGNTVSNLVNSTTGTLVSMTRGIMTIAGSNTIDNNSVHHISTLNAQSNNYNNATLIGIEDISEQAGSTQLIRGNEVYSLKNITLSTIEMYGIFFKGPATGNNEVSRNFINTFIIISTDAAYLHGISLHTGTYTCSNNIVFLGDTISTGCHIWGIWNNSNSPINVYNNTVYLNGTATNGVSTTYAFRDISTAPTSRDIRNNIFWNGRTNLTQISHYALYLASTANTTLDYNDYQFAENFAMIGSTVYPTQQDWVDLTTFDDNSISVDPELTNLGGVNPSDYQPGVVLSGTPIAGQTQDFDFVDRSLTSPTMGAWEYVPNPVEVWNGATFRRDYKRLKLAFDDINDATWTGNLTIKIRANIKETEKAVLYQSGYKGVGGTTSNYSRVHIYPTRNDIQVTGKLPTPLIELNGADGVVFDGRVDGTGLAHNLTLKNDSVSNQASTVQFINSATNDSINYCLVKGLSTALSGGIIHFSTDTTTVGTGNDNNCLLSNKITVVDSDPAVKSRVLNAVFSEGTSGKANSGLQIVQNEIFDVWSQASSSNGICLSTNTTECTISGNSIYETTTLVPSASNTYNGIRITSANGSGFVINGNFIGGKAVQCQGNPLQIGTTSIANAFIMEPLYLSVGDATATSVQGNTIKNFRVTSSHTTPFTGINIQNGLVNVTGNILGSSTGIGSIYVVGSNSSALSTGMLLSSTSSMQVANNIIGSITTTMTGSTTLGHSFIGINKSTYVGNTTITGNLIGSLTTAGSIRASSVSTANVQYVYGVFAGGEGTVTVSNNTIANLLDSTTYNHANSSVIGIRFGVQLPATNSILRNFIYGLGIANTVGSALNRMVGIQLESGSTNVSNNIIWLGNGVSNNFGLYGIYEQGLTGASNAVQHNTVYLSGTPSGVTQSTYAYYKGSNLGTTDLRNNILYNARTGGVTGKHYSTYLSGTSLLTINANDYICAGTLYNYLGGDVTSLAAWKTATSQDATSQSTIPFASPASALATQFRPSIDLFGVAVGTTHDYGQNPRSSTTPTIGAWERVNKWKGSVSIDFNTSNNWTYNMVPAPYDNVIFDDAPVRPCHLDQDRYVNDIVNTQPTYRMILNGYKLTVRGNLTFSNGAQLDASSTGAILEFDGTSTQTIPSGALYTNKVYDLRVNNTNNVILNGTVILLNTLTAVSGQLNATTVGATINYGGTLAQNVEPYCYLNDMAYNLIVSNPAGVTIRTNFTANNNLTIQTGTSLAILENVGLTVSGTLLNQAGASGLLLRSSALGTASLIQTSAGIPATVQRYIDGDTCAWHFLSTPLTGQTISGAWTPAGTYGDGTGYDLYAWYEPNSCWIYNLNTTVAPTWNTVHPQSSFVAGRGYLYAVQALTPTKQFVGNLNGGTVSTELTTSATGVYQGFNLLGNPYPSSLDWNAGPGFSRNMLNLNGGGYDIWTWSTTANNYGVYNSADADGTGTNNVTRYIAPMQAFFVRATSAGTFDFYNSARVHNGASVWLKSAQTNSADKNVRLSVSSSTGSDEVKMGFGYASNENGAMKLFSPVETAPSLYMNFGGVGYSTRRLTNTEKNKYVAVNFKAGTPGSHTLRWKYDSDSLGTIYLQDRLTNAIVDLSSTDSYEFQASPSEAPERFVLHFGTVTPVDMKLHPKVWVSAGVLNVYLENMIGDYDLRISDLQGRIVTTKKISGGEQCSVVLFGRGLYLATLENASNAQTIKVLY